MTTSFERALAAELAAEQELRSVPDWLWDGKELPVPVETIADSHYGLLVREEIELAELAGLGGGVHISGLLFPAARQIWIDIEEGMRAPGRLRFTIGHELGHWVLDCNRGRTGVDVVRCRSEDLREEGAVEDEGGRPALGQRSPYPPEEQAANQFGAALLMPGHLVESERAWLDGDVRRMAQAFGVSQRAMELRLWFLERAAQL